MPRKRNRINNFNATALVSIAILIDTFQFLFGLIPFIGGIIGSFIGLLSFMIFWVWYKMLRITFGDKMKKFVIRFSFYILDFIPFIGMLPLFTVGVIVTIKTTRDEDKEYNKKQLQKYEKSLSTPRLKPNRRNRV